MFKQWLIRRKLKASLRPDPVYLKRRLAQMSPERKARFWRNMEGLSNV